MKQVTTFLNTFFAQEQWQLKLLQQWEAILGNLKTRVTLEKINQDTLVLGVYDSSWMQELYLLSPLLIKTINAHLDQPRIKQLRFKHVHKKTIVLKKESHHYQKVFLRALTTKELAVLNDIKDVSLRAALEKFLMRCMRQENLL